ncbi:MAG: ferredoxin family protein, partial [Chloroflexota bacterium]
MATYVITEACRDVKDATCVDVCPVGCIHTTPEAPQYYIDPEVCIACEQCFFVCPVDAIFLDADVPAHLEHYLQINADFFTENKQQATAVTQDQARHVLDAVLAYAASAGLTVAAAVVDGAGAPVLAEAMPSADGASELALNKAYTAANLQVATHQL